MKSTRLKVEEMTSKQSLDGEGPFLLGQRFAVAKSFDRDCSSLLAAFFHHPRSKLAPTTYLTQKIPKGVFFPKGSPGLDSPSLFGSSSA
ncbi:hypothetical protein HPP92_026686 [Vanilla planifolia]|uniref:Uncharacterized protein n=1 Tax=Vanilla planifolia TaxID=51239 RepID=A0A835U5Q1_VANPL|nr:hypothetical protein HPP92_026686 [Vanilla planifolia]